MVPTSFYVAVTGKTPTQPRVQLFELSNDNGGYRLYTPPNASGPWKRKGTGVLPGCKTAPQACFIDPVLKAGSFGRIARHNRVSSATMDRSPHPWNRGFAWSDHAGPFVYITAQQAAQFDQLGYFVVRGAFDAATLQRLDAELAPGDEQVKRFLASAPDGRFSVAGLDTQTVAPHAVTRSAFARQFCANEMLTSIARDLVGPDVHLYWDQSVYKQPNSAEPVLWHQDNGYAYVEPQSYLTCWIAITDATPDNGCIAVMPGVHRDGTLAHRSTPIGEECWGDWSAAVEVPVSAGSIVVFSSLTPHATKPNTTGAVRKAYIVQYAPDGAVALHGDPGAGSAERREQLGDDLRRYWIVRDGERVEPASLPA